MREEAARLRGDVAAVVADAEGRSLEDREHQRLAAHDPAAARLREGLDHHLVDVHVQRASEREQDAVGDVVRGQRLDALVRRLGGGLVALEADERELGLREPRVDGRDPDRTAEEVLAESVDEAAQRELRSHVHGGVLVRLPARDRAGEEDVAAVAHVREREARDADRAVDVRVQDGRLVLRDSTR